MNMEQKNVHGDNIARDKIINNIYINTQDYQALEKELAALGIRKKKTVAKIEKYPEDYDFKMELGEINAEIEGLQEKIESFREDVFRLYETFTKIPINTERLRIAKELFDKGQFIEADVVLEAEEISSEIKQLKTAKEEKTQELAEVEESLETKANEFLVKAQLWKTFYTKKGWFQRTIEYYEKALSAAKKLEILFEYALFLQNHNQYIKAQPLYEEALQIYRKLAEENPRTYLPYVATTLNNLANLQKAKNEFGDALEKYEEALQIYRKLAEENPRTYLPDVAMTLNNLANLQKAKNEFGDALEKYEEALQIYRKLAEENPRTYLPRV